jgi:hypothetical protein
MNSLTHWAVVHLNHGLVVFRELSLRKGDVVTITRLVDSNWYEGQLRRAVGIFPVSYVQVSRLYSWSVAVFV